MRGCRGRREEVPLPPRSRPPAERRGWRPSYEVFQALVLAGLSVLAIAAALGFTWLAAYNEARTFERLTGRHVTTWDALWVELRVQEPVK